MAKKALIIGIGRTSRCIKPYKIRTLAYQKFVAESFGQPIFRAH